MTKRSLLAHGCWAIVAVAAFSLGSMREKGDSGRADYSPRAKGDRSAARPMRGSSGSNAERESGLSRRSVSRTGIRSDRNEVSSVTDAPLGEAQLSALAEEAFRSGSPLVRRAAFGQLLEALTADNASTILAQLKEHKVDKAQWRDFHYAWGMLDGEAAVKHAMQSKEYDMAYTMSGWASTYPEEAQRFFNNLPEDVKTDRELLKRSLVSGMADRDTNSATDFVFRLAGQGEGQASNLLAIVAEEVLHNQGTAEAAFWSGGLPDGPLKGAAMDRVAHSYVQRDPEAAAQWAEQFAGQDYAGRVIEEVGDEWAERNPVAAVNWLESLPEGQGQSSGLSSAFGEWAKRDPVAAGERITGMPRSPQRDHAINGYASVLSYRDPSTAIEWANSISQDSLRNSALTRAGQSLFRRDAEAARAWVATSGLPPQAQQQVLNPPRRR